MEVKSNQTLSAFCIRDENDLDTFLTENVRDYDSLSRKKDRVTVEEKGVELFEFSWGDWLVVFPEFGIKSYSQEEFDQNFLKDRSE